MVEVFFGMDWKEWVFLLAALCVLLLIVLACLIIYHRHMIRYKNRGIVKQIFARDRCEEELMKLSNANVMLYEMLQQSEAKAQAKQPELPKLPELYLLATQKPFTPLCAKDCINDGSFKIFPLRTVEE